MSRNRLAAEASSYLRSAAHQPIHWYPWGEDAFAAARRNDRPVLLDIGAVWCHWCHVMDAESYDDPGLADFLNQHFVCVKVDRDERPDVDARYQRAVQSFSGQGGWPLTALLTPEGDVFYGGTYFPPDGRHGRPGFRTVLERVLGVWRERRDEVLAQAATVRRFVDGQLDETAPAEPEPALLEDAERQMVRLFDPAHGGFGGAPKFPHPMALRFLLGRWADRPDETLRRVVERTLDAMARGGIHDQLGGGFHRYSVDAKWIVPHFEKMSYDNAALLDAYADAAAAFGSAAYAEVARGIVRWVRDTLADPAGGYGASQDADVGVHDDGDYFTWTRDEAAAVLDPDELAVAAAWWDIGTAGEMHHDPARNVLFVATAPESVAALTGRSAERVHALLESARAKLLAARTARQAPFVDPTRYAAWNAMLASALLRAWPVLQDDWAREHALATLRRMRREAPEPDALPHTPGGRGGLLDDQVQAAAAALDAWEATGDRDWLDWSAALLERVWRDYRTGSGGLADVASAGGEGLLPVRATPVADSPTPSPNGTAALAAGRLAAHTGDARWDERAAALVGAFAGRARELGLHAATLLVAADRLLHPATHLVVVGAPGDPVADVMHRQALATFVPRRVVQRLAPGTPADGLPPALAGMLAAGAAPRGYACRGTVCSAPAGDPGAWAAALAAPPGAAAG